jgi:hypothetical protein
VETKIEKPIVQTFHRGMPKSRNGRGYSMNEIFQAGVVNLQVALGRDIPIDKLRSSSYPENIKNLRKFFEQTKTIAKAQSSIERRVNQKSSIADKGTSTKRNSVKKQVSKKSKRSALKKIISKSD